MADPCRAMAVPATYKTKRSYTDGSIEVRVLVEQRDERHLLDICSEPGAPLALARLTPEAAKAEMTSSTFGAQARELRLSAFFRTESVWRAIGSDAGLKAWTRSQKCKSCGSSPCDPAHVRSVAAGAGTGIKPDYSVIPLCFACHRIVQHEQGICTLTKIEDKYEARERLQRWRIDSLVAWGWEVLKSELGYDSWSQVPPASLLAWADEHGLSHLLPESYR